MRLVPNEQECARKWRKKRVKSEDCLRLVGANSFAEEKLAKKISRLLQSKSVFWSQVSLSWAESKCVSTHFRFWAIAKDAISLWQRLFSSIVGSTRAFYESITSGLWFFFRPPESVAFRAAALLPPASPPHPNFQSLINPPRLIGFWIGNLGGKWVELMWTPLEH